MNKLLKFREWLTVGEAARRLTISAQEDISEADILRLALDGSLTLSVRFINHAKGRPVRIEPVEQQLETDQEFEDFLNKFPNSHPTEDDRKAFYNFVRKYRGDYLPGGKEMLVYEGDGQKPITLEGVWDLLMLGAEVLDIEHEYQNLSGGPGVDLVCLGGPLVSSPDRKHMFQLLDSYRRDVRPSELASIRAKPDISKEGRKAIDRMNELLGPVKTVPMETEDEVSWDYENVYYPAAGLPADHTIVVRTTALRKLEKELLCDEENLEKPLHSSERKSVAQIVAALAGMANLDLSSPYKAVGILRREDELKGLDLPGSDETIVKFLSGPARNKR